MNEEVKLIGLSGQLQNGKDTVADLILKLTARDFDDVIGERIEEWYTKRFAGKLKQMVAVLIGCKLQDLENETFKNTPLNEIWRVYPVKVIDGYNRIIKTQLFNSELERTEFLKTESYRSFSINNPNYSDITYKIVDSYVLTPRMVLQLLGTEGGRDIIHPNIWINATLGDIKEDDKVIVTDVRFPNEADAIRRIKGGIVVRVVRPSKVSTSTHPSETSLNDYMNWDYVITNDGTLEDLEDKVRAMLTHFNIPQLVNND